MSKLHLLIGLFVTKLVSNVSTKHQKSTIFNAQLGLYFGANKEQI